VKRNHQREIEDRILAEISGTGWAVPVVAAHLYNDLKEHDPDLLRGWLEEMALPLLTQQVGDLARAQRSRARREAAAGAEHAETPRRPSLYHVTHVLSGVTRKRACDMTGPEHRLVAHRYENAGVQSLMLGAFHTAIADKVGERRTSEVFTREEYERMYRSVTVP
jgi:hypothetical protein